MTSWDALEAFLLDLVRKVGGVSYALQDSGGRHLAPRPPPPVDKRAILDAYIRRRFLEDKPEDSPPEPDPVRVAEDNRSRTLARLEVRIAIFKKHSALLDAAVGVDFVSKGPGKRFVHREAPFPFVAERFLSSFLLFISFREVAAVDAQGVVLALERARSVISDMLGDLPPDDGGDRAIAHSQRPA